MNDWQIRWPNFAPHEVLSPAGLYTLKEKGVLMMRPETLDKLQLLRIVLEQKLYVNHAGLTLRGYRAPEENASIPFHTNFSAHIMGSAVDVTPEDQDLEQLYNTAIQNGFVWGKIYEDKNFVHLEDRLRYEQKLL